MTESHRFPRVERTSSEGVDTCSWLKEPGGVEWNVNAGRL
jgi:hypothetical protein